jgi:hypothetical protein
VYPDTTVWIKDYAYSYNGLLTIIFGTKYGDYPVVGVKWTQAQAFLSVENFEKNSYQIKRRA